MYLAITALNQYKTCENIKIHQQKSISTALSRLNLVFCSFIQIEVMPQYIKWILSFYHLWMSRYLSSDNISGLDYFFSVKRAWYHSQYIKIDTKITITHDNAVCVMQVIYQFHLLIAYPDRCSICMVYCDNHWGPFNSIEYQILGYGSLNSKQYIICPHVWILHHRRAVLVNLSNSAQICFYCWRGYTDNMFNFLPHYVG